MHCIVFDVDGTLIDSNRVDGELYISAIRTVLGPLRIREKWSSYKNVTDAGILQEIIAENRVRNSDVATAEIKRVFVESIERHIAQNGPFRELPGAKEFVAEICATPDHVCAYATGGWRVSAMLKLETSGFNVEDIPLSSSDDSAERRTIMLRALEKHGESFESVTYYGDGSWDREA